MYCNNQNYNFNDPIIQVKSYVKRIKRKKGNNYKIHLFDFGIYFELKE